MTSFEQMLQQYIKTRNPNSGMPASSSAEQQVRTQNTPSGSAPQGFYMPMADGRQQFIPAFRTSDIVYGGDNVYSFGGGDGGGSDALTQRLLGQTTLNNVGNYFPGWNTLNPTNFVFSQGGENGAYDPNVLRLMVKSGERTGSIIDFEQRDGYWVPKGDSLRTQNWDTNAAANQTNLAALAAVAAFAAPVASWAAAGGGALGGASGAAAPVAGSSGASGLGGIDALIAAGEGIVPISSTGATGAAASTAAGTVGGNAALGAGTGIGGAMQSGLNVGNILNSARTVGDLLGSINSIGGGSRSTSQSGTEVKQTQISEEGIMEIVRRILADPNSGVNSIMSQGQGAGVFNNSNQALMLSNLIARAAGTAAVAGAPTITSGSGTGRVNDNTFIEDLLKKWF